MWPNKKNFVLRCVFVWGVKTTILITTSQKSSSSSSSASGDTDRVSRTEEKKILDETQKVKSCDSKIRTKGRTDLSLTSPVFLIVCPAPASSDPSFSVSQLQSANLETRVPPLLCSLPFARSSQYFSFETEQVERLELCDEWERSECSWMVLCLKAIQREEKK